MLPVLMQPFSSIATANMQMGLGVASSFANGIRQLNELNMELMQSTLADNRDMGRHPLTMFAQLPARAFSYGTGLMSIAGQTATDVFDAFTGRMFSPRNDAPKLVLVNGGNTAHGETAILDANGNVVSRVTR